MRLKCPECLLRFVVLPMDSDRNTLAEAKSRHEQAPAQQDGSRCSKWAKSLGRDRKYYGLMRLMQKVE